MAGKTMEARYMLEGELEAIETIESRIDYLEEQIYKPEDEEQLSDWQKEANDRNQRKIEGLKLIIELLLKQEKAGLGEIPVPHLTNMIY